MKVVRFAIELTSYYVWILRWKTKRLWCERFHANEPTALMVNGWWLPGDRFPVTCKKCGSIKYRRTGEILKTVDNQKTG